MTFRDKLGLSLVPVLLLLSGCNPAPDIVHKKLHAEQGTYVADISETGAFSVVSTNDNGILLWPRYANNAKYSWRHDDETSQVIAVDISPDGTVVATATRFEFALWDATAGDNLGFWKIGSGGIQDVAVSNEGSVLILGKRDGTQIAFSPDSGRRLEFYGHTERVNSVEVSANGFYVLSGSNDASAILWDTRSGQIVHRWQHKNRVTQIALHPEAKYVFTSGSTDNAKIWRLPDGKEHSRLKFIDRQRIFSSARFSASGDTLLTGSPSRRINLWDTQSGESIRHWNVGLVDDRNPNSAVVLSLHYYDNDNIVFSESSAGLAEWWQLPADWNQE
ncbi:hypothetical protein LG288_10695 [Idiomarina seosinensis]|uniref:WD40 repeat domain-containing protein n=1 Tax=Idiomarina seosinensis TaxID=281739 RepID=UPI00384D6AF5